MTPETLTAAAEPTMYFIGVTTGSSAIHRVFSNWRPMLGLDGVALTGIDIPLGAEPDQYRRVVDFIRNDPLSRGALVTTHKVAMYEAAHDLLREIDEDASRLGEVSALVNGPDGVSGLALDTITSELSLRTFVPDLTDRDVLVMGSGGAGSALCDYFAHRAPDRPSRVVVTDVSVDRLDALQRESGARSPITWQFVKIDPGDVHDDLLRSLGSGAVVINATGLGKDRPGSPLSDIAMFPLEGYVWDFNYRGELGFLRQARAQQMHRRLTVEDGWRYFVHGWTRAVEAVFGVSIPTSGPRFDALYEASGRVR